MTTEIKNEIAEPSFKGRRSTALRIWHWGTFIVILGSLITVLFAKTLLSTKDNTSIVQANLLKNNVAVTADQAKSVAHEFNDMVWHWHILLGYVLASLLGFRILFEFFQPKRQRIIPVFKNTLNYLRLPGANKENGKHFMIVRCLYILFYFALTVQTCTGLFMVYSDDVESLKSIRHTTKEVHSVFMWVIITYIVLHLGGVILAELGKKNRGIVSDMINGGE